MELLEIQKTATVYKLKTETDVQMSVQETTPTIEGAEQPKEIIFHLTDEVSENWSVDLVASISKEEAKELIKVLQKLVSK